MEMKSIFYKSIYDEIFGDFLHLSYRFCPVCSKFAFDNFYKDYNLCGVTSILQFPFLKS